MRPGHRGLAARGLRAPVTGADPAAVASRLAGCRVLLAYGLLGEVLARFGRLGVDYMGAQRDWLLGLGLPAEVVPVPTAAPVAANALRLRAALASDPRPAVLVAHSKGGLEALAALLDPDSRARCRAFIALQSPFLGSPVADALCALRPLHRTAGGILRRLGLGGDEGLRDLTTAARADWMATHAAEVAALPGRLPVLCGATWLEAEHATGPDRRYLPLARWVERRGGGPNDGLVPVASALLPGARQMLRPGGHRALVATGRGRDPVGALRDALEAVLAGPAEAEAVRTPGSG
jgi:hypothetical protein